MSMLAERKRKQRWSLNPRGQQFTEDKNNFGHKMLQKMGWKHGKGLGANEDGISESLRVTYKNDMQGMGYKETEACTEHDSNFSSLLKNLTGNDDTKSKDIKVTALQKKSENSRARIHYHKFTKGKDISQYSQKDLASIFGKKTLQENDRKCEIVELKEEKTCIDENLINKGSMTDYFKKKFENFTQNFKNKKLKTEQSDSDQERVGFGFMKQETKSGSANVTNLNEGNQNFKNKKLRSEQSDSDQERVGFGFKKQETESDSVNVTNFNEENQNCGKIKMELDKKKREWYAIIPFVYETNESNSEIAKANENPQEEIVKCKSKKKKKKKDEYLEDSGNIQENPDENMENSPKKVKKKSKKAKNCEFVEENEIETLNLEENIQDKPKIKQIKAKEARIDEDLDQNIESFPKSKRKKLKKDEINDYIEEIPQGEVNFEENTKKIKHKKEKQSEIKENIEENDEKLDISTESKKNKDKRTILDKNNDKFEVENVNESKKNKKKKSKIQDFDKIDVIEEKTEIGTENVINEEEESPQKKHKKSMKSKKNKEEPEIGISNLAFNDLDSTIDSNSSRMVENDEITPKKKKNKRKYEDISQGIENPTFDDISNSKNESNSNFEVVKPKKRKKSKDIDNKGLDNPALNLSDIVINDDLVLNVITTPILKKEVPKYLNITKIRNVKRKSVRFSNILQERIIPNDPNERSNEYIMNRNELFDINTSVIEENLKEEMKKQGLEYQNITGKFELNDSEDISKRIVASSVQEELNRSNGNMANSGFINNGFDIRSIDKINFYDCKYEIKSSNEQQGIDNEGFNKFNNKIEENIEDISNKIDNYQVEVENDINETKDNKRNSTKPGFRNHYIKNTNNNYNHGNNSNNENYNDGTNGNYKNCDHETNNTENYATNYTDVNYNHRNNHDETQLNPENIIGKSSYKNNPKVETNQIHDCLVGDVGTQLIRNIKVDDGSKLCFKDMCFKSNVPYYVQNSASKAKKSYRHLIRGDITVAFKNSNLHDIKGYANKAPSKE